MVLPLVFLATGITFLALSVETVLKKNSVEDPIIIELKRRLARIDPNYGKIEMYTGTESYTRNKEEIYICTLDPKGKAYDMNTLTYVALHEMAHVLSRPEDDDHGPYFREEFKKLLIEARRAGIWTPQIEMPNTYCGVVKP